MIWTSSPAATASDDPEEDGVLSARNAVGRCRGTSDSCAGHPAAPNVRLPDRAEEPWARQWSA